MVASTNTDVDAGSSAGRATGSAYTHGGDTEFARENADIGYEEAQSTGLFGDTRAWNVNQKRTYDIYQTADMDSLHRQRALGEKFDSLCFQAMQNAVETANMVGKQAVRHSDLAIDRQWNIDEVSGLSAKSGVEADAVVAAMVAAVADVINKANS